MDIVVEESENSGDDVGPEDAEESDNLGEADMGPGVTDAEISENSSKDVGSDHPRKV